MRVSARQFSPIRSIARQLLAALLLLLLLLALPAQALSFSTELQTRGGHIRLNVHEGHYAVTEQEIIAWVERSAEAVSRYFGRFPVRRLRLEVGSEYGNDVGFGMAFGFDHHIEVNIGNRATADELANDWVLVHEMIHMGHPDVGNRHKWFKEGLATYVEPIARARAGLKSPEAVWGGFLSQMPQGQPRRGDRGLDHTPTWGRTYWGGALFWLVADVEIRRQSKNTRGLDDALRAILRAGGTLDRDWRIRRALEIGDRATGTTVLQDTYERMRAAPTPVDLQRLWNELGVSSSYIGRISLSDDAPLAQVRQSITSPGDASTINADNSQR